MTSFYASPYKNQPCCPCTATNYTSTEPPERDISKRPRTGYENVTYAGDFPPPEPPMGQYGDWELQFCKWWGWTWVKKGDKDVRLGEQPYRRVTTVTNTTIPPAQVNRNPPVAYSEHQHMGKTMATNKRRKRCFFDCLRPKQRPQRPIPLPPRAAINTQAQTEMSSYRVDVPIQPESRRIQHNNHRHSRRCCDDYSSSDDCCCCYCCNMPPVTYCCCSCGQCGQCGGNNTKNQQTNERRVSKTIETQTLKSVKEQETQHNFKNKEIGQNTSTPCLKRRHKKCCRRRCCNNPCSPCVRPVCCTCSCVHNNHNNINTNNDSSPRVSASNYVEKAVNYCEVPTRVPKQVLNDLSEKHDFTKYKSKNFSILHKPLDLLLKNNINIVKMFQDKEFVKIDDKKRNFLDSSDTISFLSTRSEHGNKPDKEHCKLLTAVCDAILSSHKFENEQNPIFENILRVANSKSTHITRSTTISSESLNLDKILNDKSNYYYAKKIAGQAFDPANLHIKSDIGIQAGEQVQKVESFSQTKKFEALKLTRIPTPLMKKKIVRAGTFSCDINNRGFKRTGNNFIDLPSDNENKKLKTSLEDKEFESPDVSGVGETNPKLEDIERILNCINFDIGSSNTLEQYEALFQDRSSKECDVLSNVDKPSTSK